VVRVSRAPAGNAAIAESGTVKRIRNGDSAVIQKRTSPFFTPFATKVFKMVHVLNFFSVFESEAEAIEACDG